jgi:hypothetical protein
MLQHCSHSAAALALIVESISVVGVLREHRVEKDKEEIPWTNPPITYYIIISKASRFRE